jgi:hypothetical protein
LATCLPQWEQTTERVWPLPFLDLPLFLLFDGIKILNLYSFINQIQKDYLEAEIRFIKSNKISMAQENPMKEVKIEKLVINLCVGESGDKLTKAQKVAF